MAFGFFDGQKADASPESIKRKRAMIAQLLSGGRAPRNIGEGFSSIGDSVAAAILGSRADAEEKAGNAERSRIMGGIGFGGAPMASAGNPVATGSATGSGATGAVSGKGYDNPQARETYEYAIAQGLAPHQAAAYTGAKLAESRFNPNARNPGDGRDGSDSIGGFQWNSGRAQALKQYAAQQGKSWNDPAVQRAFSFAELNGSERAAGQALRNAKTPEEATAAMLSYLRPGGWTARNPLGAHSAPARLRNTQGILSAFGNMPVINPGNGATPMPLARQQAQTAPMPNVASVQGDNPQQLLADAAYYEKNGNPEAARQMRERAQLATARPVQTASAGPKSNEGQTQDGAGELQAGGSGLMGLAGVGVNPASPPDMAQIAGAQGFADNEEQTRAMEAQMAADQGLPYAGNEPGLLSPVPMGFGPNPFLPRDMVQPPDAMAQAAPTPIAPTFTGQGVAPSWAGDAEALAPGAQEASGPNNGPFPTPPPRPADLRPQSPLIPPAMRQPIAPMEASENGAGAMQFIESEFARREGRPDPRMAIGAPQGYNPFVPQALQAPQMAGDGGSVQGASQGGEMAGGSAQPQQAGMITPQNVRAVMSSPFTSDADKRFVMDMWNQQQARVQAEAERARVAEQNRQTARDLGLPESLGGVAPVVTARAQQKYAKPEPATSDQRELEQINKERRDANLPALRMDEWKTQKARAGAASVSVDASQKAESAFSVETGKALAKRFDEMVGEGDAAAQNLEVVADLRRLGTGIGTGAYAVVQSYLGKLGIKTEGLSQIEAYNALIDRLTPQQRLPGSGATSDFDAKMFKGSLTSLMNTPEGNNLIVDSMERIIQNRIARGDIALRVQTGELSQREGLAEIRKLQAQARDISTAARDFGKTKTITTDRPGAAQPQQGQPTAAEIEAELKRRGLR
jgi:hypothetical protein